MSVIQQLHDSILTISGTLSYDEVTDLFLKLPEAVEHFEEFDWTTDLGFCSVDELIVGAYWHYTEWHGGQSSPGYAVLSALGTIFSPGMEEPDTNNSVYVELRNMAVK